MNDLSIEPNFPEGTKVKLISYDPLTNIFTEGPEEIVHHKSSNDHLMKLKED